jgi:hypothetical protein
MTCFFAAKTPPNMIGLTAKNIIIKKQLKKKFKVPGDLFCTIFEDYLNADWLVYWTVSMRIGWFTDAPPIATIYTYADI